ncbi:uncharacterized protein LOC110452353 isoform X1 [Mizuhopecten yessoensis]|uniref:uncharacterized protein LOC110452353 isoform X1 n=1 Tax=Mizuhopecten yessoensis TaxID=6573 RepID=UPI000B45C8AD|nr:uncharacterized protein LOC110452353 isoform X1 [Mizuhopecten yessoensis]
MAVSYRPRLHSIIWNSRTINQLFMFHRRNTCIQMREVIHSHQGYLSQQIKYFRQVMDEPSRSVIMAADSVLNGLDFQKVISKIWCRMKHGFQQKYLIEAKQTCVNVDPGVQIQSELTNSVLRCENGNDMGSNSCDSSDQPPAVEATSTSSNVTETSNTNSGCSGHKKGKQKRKLPRSRLEVKPNTKSSTAEISCHSNEENTRNKPLIPSPDQYLALDCEYLKNSSEGSITKLGRCSIVDYHGNVVFDMYSCPEELVANYRTSYSGLVCGHMTNAVPFEVVQKIVKDLLKGKILVAHDIKQDLILLNIDHPAQMIRDTLFHPVLIKKAKDLGCDREALRPLAWCLLGRRIQTLSRTHCSVEDATATMDLFKLVRVEWEESIDQQNSDVNEIGIKMLNPVTALNEFAQKLRWELPEYQCKRLSSENPPKFVYTVLVNDEGYRSTGCPNKKEAKAAAAEAFFVHHRRSESDTYMDVFKHITSNTESDNQTNPKLDPVLKHITSNTESDNQTDPSTELGPVTALNNVSQKLRWELPEYQYERLSSEVPPKFVCKVLVNDEGYRSTGCPNKKEAKAAAAEAFFVHHRRSESDTYMDVFKHITSNTESDNQTNPKLGPVTALNNVTQKLRWELPEYQYEHLSSEVPPKLVCKVLVNDEGYQSTGCSNEKEAKAAAAEAFFVHHRRSESDTYMDVLKHITSNTESENKKDPKLDPITALNQVTEKLRWELPEYQYERLSSEDPPKFVCKVLVNDEWYQSTSGSNKKEAKAAAAEAFFVHHRRSESETYMDVFKHITFNTWLKNQPNTICKS